MGYLRVYLRRFAGWFALAVLFLSTEAIADLMQPTIMASIIDEGVANRDIGFVLSRSALMLAIAAIGTIAAVSRNLLASRISQRFGAELRHDLYRKTISLSFGALDRFETASLVTRLTNDVTQVQNFINGMMRIFVKAPLVAIGGVVMAVLLDVQLARVLQIGLPVVAALLLLSIRLGYPRYRVVQERLDGVNGVFREYLGGVRVVKAFNRFDHEARRFAAANHRLADASAAAMRVMAMFTPSIALAMNLGIVVVLWFGGYRVDAGEAGAGNVIAFVNYMTQILFALMITAFIFNTFVRARASSDRIREVMAAAGEAPRSRVVTATSGSPPATNDHVRFEQVSFTYGEELSGESAGLAALRDVSFNCQRDEVTGIIGSTGSGKTTLVGLIPRFRDPSSGAVFVDGVDTRAQGEHDLRRRIGIVPQRTLLFSGTVMENLRWGCDNAEAPEVERAARIAQAHDFITALPDGYQARVGRGGVNLSGGQKQRVAIARALLRWPEILILDDASSALDSMTEARLRDALRHELSTTTLIVVAQRVSSVINAHRIVVLDDGETRGVGTHRELLSDSEVYRDIHRSQIGMKEADRD